jgi:hypothetical protein
MPAIAQTAIAVVGIDIGKNSFHIMGLDDRRAIVLRQKWSRNQVEARFANMSPRLIGMEACIGAHHLSRKLNALGHDARLSLVTGKAPFLGLFSLGLPVVPTLRLPSWPMFRAIQPFGAHPDKLKNHIRRVLPQKTLDPFHYLKLVLTALQKEPTAR